MTANANLAKSGLVLWDIAAPFPNLTKAKNPNSMKENISQKKKQHLIRSKDND